MIDCESETRKEGGSEPPEDGGGASGPRKGGKWKTVETGKQGGGGGDDRGFKPLPLSDTADRKNPYYDDPETLADDVDGEAMDDDHDDDVDRQETGVDQKGE